MKEAKSRLQEIRKDRGFGKAGAGGGGRSNAGVPAARKASQRCPCFDSGQSCHWAGDKECPKPGAGLARKPAPKAKVRQVRIAEMMQADHVSEYFLGSTLFCILRPRYHAGSQPAANLRAQGIN